MEFQKKRETFHTFGSDSAIDFSSNKARIFSFFFFLENVKTFHFRLAKRFDISPAKPLSLLFPNYFQIDPNEKTKVTTRELNNSAKQHKVLWAGIKDDVSG